MQKDRKVYTGIEFYYAKSLLYYVFLTWHLLVAVKKNSLDLTDKRTIRRH